MRREDRTLRGELHEDFHLFPMRGTLGDMQCYTGIMNAVSSVILYYAKKLVPLRMN